MTAKQILQKLKDDLGHITLVADWADREAKNLGAELEQPVLSGHGAGDPPAVVNAETAPNEAPAEGEAQADGNTTQPATSAPSEGSAAPAQDAAPLAEAV